MTSTITDQEEQTIFWKAQQRVRKRPSGGAGSPLATQEWKNLTFSFVPKPEYQIIGTAETNTETLTLHHWRKNDVKQIMCEPGNKQFSVVTFSGEVFQFRTKSLKDRKALTGVIEKLVVPEKFVKDTSIFWEEAFLPITATERFPYHATVKLSYLSNLSQSGKFENIKHLDQNSILLERS